MTYSVVELELADAAATVALGVRVGRLVTGTMMLGLTGQLGAGKTTLVQGLARGLGIRESVSSPTFLMLNEYHSGRMPLYHADFYRLSQAAQTGKEILLQEIEEMKTTDCVIVVEWAELFAEVFDLTDHLLVRLEYADNGRRAYLEPHGAAAGALALGLAAN